MMYYFFWRGFFMKDYLGRDREISFIFPIDGDCLNEFDGAERDGCLWIKARVKADKNAKIEINENPAGLCGEYFEAEVPLMGHRTTLVAEDVSTGKQTNIAVYRLKDCVGRYRLSSDDNILFLKDINDNKDKYESIFENPYLAMYKEAHDKYGACVHLNIYYETDEQVGFSEKREYFNLSMMTDKFKDEWRKNVDWLRLSFHARHNSPDKPYKYTNMKRIGEDARLVNKEIIRFAGEETLSPVTTVHWGECTIKGLRELRNLGTRCFCGYFSFMDGEPVVSYFYPADLVAHIDGRDFWRDNEEDILFGKIDLVLNCHKLSEIVPLLEAVKENPHKGGFVEFMIHEQYFYKDYVNYIPEFKEIVLTACKWAYDNGYKGKLLSELL